MFDYWREIRASGPFVPPPDSSPAHEKELTKTERKQLTVLVVDDERLIADTTTEILKMSGFKAICAYDGRSALEIAMRVAPDFILTDVVMPIMDGVELATAIRKALPATQIVLLSGQAGTAEILDVARKQGYSFELLSKPIHPERIIQRIKKS
jgi:CheY-like chemotaxis protein